MLSHRKSVFKFHDDPSGRNNTIKPIENSLTEKAVKDWQKSALPQPLMEKMQAISKSFMQAAADRKDEFGAWKVLYLQLLPLLSEAAENNPSCGKYNEYFSHAMFQPSSEPQITLAVRSRQDRQFRAHLEVNFGTNSLSLGISGSYEDALAAPLSCESLQQCMERMCGLISNYQPPEKKEMPPEISASIETVARGLASPSVSGEAKRDFLVKLGKSWVAMTSGRGSFASPNQEGMELALEGAFYMGVNASGEKVILSHPSGRRLEYTQAKPEKLIAILKDAFRSFELFGQQD